MEGRETFTHGHLLHKWWMKSVCRRRYCFANGCQLMQCEVCCVKSLDNKMSLWQREHPQPSSSSGALSLLDKLGILLKKLSSPERLSGCCWHVQVHWRNPPEPHFLLISKFSAAPHGLFQFSFQFPPDFSPLSVTRHEYAH